MPAQHGLNGHMRMVELAGEPHAEPLHDGARCQIADKGEGHEFRFVQDWMC